jgi:hypothetical protein
MSKIALEGNASGTGTFTIAGPNTNTNYTITLPQETGTLVTTGVTTGLNGSAISTGVVAASVGGTGITSVGTSGNVLTSNGTAWVSQAAAAGDYIMNVYTSTTPGQVWTKPAGLKAIKVTVIGGGGSGNTGSGGTSSFGSPALLSATGGGGSISGNSNASGAGSGGNINASGSDSIVVYTGACSNVFNAWGGASAFGFAGFRGQTPASPGNKLGYTYGGGGLSFGPFGGAGGAGAGGGGAIKYIDAPALPGPQPFTVGAGGANPAPTPVPNRSTGGDGIVIVEEFY